MIQDSVATELVRMLRPALTPLISVSDTPIASNNNQQLLPGDKVTAYVVATLPGDRFQVQVQDQLMDMNLPTNTQPGQTLELTFLSNDPRPTFLLQPPQAAVALPPAPNVALSQEARALETLAQQPGPAAATSTAPLLARPPVETATAAAALQQGLEQSGLFYEAHLAQWVNGERDLASMRQEPQAQLPPLPPALGQANSAEALPLPAAAIMTTTGAEATADAAGQALQAAAPALPISEQSLALLRAQMQVLDSGILRWHGEAWPGQQMDWQIRPDGQTDADVAGQTWRTRVELTLPDLGKVTAVLTLSPQGLDVACRTEASSTGRRLKAGGAALQQQMLSAGLAMTGFSVTGKNNEQV